jgi:hypothetical protein
MEYNYHHEEVDRFFFLTKYLFLYLYYLESLQLPSIPKSDLSPNDELNLMLNSRRKTFLEKNVTFHNNFSCGLALPNRAWGRGETCWVWFGNRRKNSYIFNDDIDVHIYLLFLLPYPSCVAFLGILLRCL